MRQILLWLTLGLLISSPLFAAEDRESDRMEMIEKQIKGRGIRDPQVLEAMASVPRHLFVPKEIIPFAYEDRALAIGHRQTISQPYIVAYMTEVLHLKPSDRVLEIGTGSGYQAAVLSKIVQAVYSVEIIAELAGEAKARLEELGYANVQVKAGDGYQGWAEYAPYDAVIVTAAPDVVPQTLIDQLKPGGRMIVPVGESGNQQLVLLEKTANGILKEKKMAVRFVPMVKEDRDA
ncbi:MAG: protein-L-isoaspartate(D-aspartate) O-methyltransferase [Candidatus Omnitrophica bacterium]|nr:protein-L-isoaspartate(D-aspartate) O-methyltransferase [Candidatus Omnitrophota bacterium]